MSNLSIYLSAALRLTEDWDGRPQDAPWRWVRAALSPGQRFTENAARLLSLALDLVGVAYNPDHTTPRLRTRYTDTGVLDQSLALRRAFLAGDFGPREELEAALLDVVSGRAKGVGARPAEKLALALERAGFAPIGDHFERRGAERVAIGETIRLKLDHAESLPLARSRSFSSGGEVAGDDLLARHAFGFSRYRSAAQRDVIRELLKSDGARAIVARMPTGGGKSLAFLLPSAEWKRRGEAHTAVIVSPVIALQNDQVRRITEEYNATGLAAAEINSTVAVEMRTAIYRRLRRGQLDLLFLSPEKLVEPFFRETLVASMQHVRLLVIDEAHMVAEWGQDFRTDFFRLGRVRARLVERNSDLRTLFLSATLTEENERELLRVFALPDVARFTAATLRRELSIRVQRFQNREEKVDALLDYVKDLPPPAIVYCTQKKHVRELRTALKEAGIRRVATYTGDTPPDERRARLDALHRNELDVVLATNAFGLGIDKGDIRTVVHFDVPHNLDAYYQEIGRAARDGRTGHALLLYSPGSMGHATRSERAVLTAENASERAKRMLRGRVDLAHDGDGGCLVPLHAVPAHLSNDSGLNRGWNLATLNLLDQVGDLAVEGQIIRHVIINRGERRAAVEAFAGVAAVLKGKQLPAKVDLAHAAKRAGIPLSRLEAEVIGAALAGAIELETADEERGEAWALVYRRRDRTWSASHVERLEQYRALQVDSANRGLRDLRRFINTRGCRQQPLAALYGLPFDGPCGHCDRCQPSLALGG